MPLPAPLSPHVPFMAGVLVVSGLWLWNGAATMPDDAVHVAFLDAGGPATFVRTASGVRVLIDGGANPSELLGALGERLPFWDRALDLIVLTNTDDAHLAGAVAALERYPVKQILQVNLPAKPTAALVKWRDLIVRNRCPCKLHKTQCGLRWSRGYGLRYGRRRTKARACGCALAGSRC